MDSLSRAVEKIIEEQEQIIGPIALEQAQKVDGLKVDWDKKTVSITGDKGRVVDLLVERYKAFFGPAAVEVCKDAARAVGLPESQIPASLR